MEISEGGTYLFAPKIGNKVSVWGEKELNQLKLCIFKKMKCTPYQLSPTYVVWRFDFKFVDVENGEKHHVHMMYDADLTEYVFKDVDDYLQFLVADIKFRNQTLEENRKKKGVIGKRKLKKFVFDDFLQKKILESQENYPEKWV